MDDQLVMGELPECEKLTFSIIKQTFSSIITAAYGTDENCCFTKIAGGLSISFFDDNNKSFWVCFGKNTYKLEVKSFYSQFVDTVERFYADAVPNAAGRFVTRFAHTHDLLNLSKLIVDVYAYRELEAKGQLFDCCHRFEECSDAMDCTHPDKDFRMGCSYRRKLKRGIIFFGKNRNID